MSWSLNLQTSIRVYSAELKLYFVNIINCDIFGMKRLFLKFINYENLESSVDIT